MTTPKMPRAGQSVMPLHTHTVKDHHGRVYSYRGHRIAFWFSDDEIDLLERIYNYEKNNKLQDFTDKERSTLSKFLKAVIIKYSLRAKEIYIDEK